MDGRDFGGKTPTRVHVGRAEWPGRVAGIAIKILQSILVSIRASILTATRIATRIPVLVPVLVPVLAPVLAPIPVLAAGADPPRTGADVSFVPQLRSLGAEFLRDGTITDPVEILRDEGYELARLRLWHSPTEPWHGLDSTLAFAAELKAEGFELLLDLHYSDNWADPGTQTKPAVWQGLSFAALTDSVYAYTKSVLEQFVAAGVRPEYVQVGNEINAGFLWDDGRVGWPGSPWDTDAQWDQFALLLEAGIQGVFEGTTPGPTPEIILHVAGGGDNVVARWFVDHLLDRSVDFDVIGVSFYPWWHGELTDVGSNLRDLATRYGKEIQIVECAYPWTLEGFDETGNFVTSEDQLHPGYAASPADQLQFLRDLYTTLHHLPGELGGAMYYWEPTWISVAGGAPNPYENLALFNDGGEVHPGLGFGQDLWASEPSRYSSIRLVGDFSDWSLDVPGMTQIQNGVWVDTLEVAAGCHLFKFVTDGAWDVPLDYGTCTSEEPDCGVGLSGDVCFAAYPGSALGQIEFPIDGAYEFRLDEREWTYEITELLTTGTGTGTGNEDEGENGNGNGSKDLSRAGPTLHPIPSPFDSTSGIRFELPATGHVRVTVYDVGGRMISVLVDAVLAAGEHETHWNGRADLGGHLVPSGPYFLHVDYADRNVTRKLMRVQ